MTTKSDFQDWKRHPVTQAVFSELEARAKYLVEEVVEQTPFISQSELAEKTGAIKAIRDMLSTEFIEESQDGN